MKSISIHSIILGILAFALTSCASKNEHKHWVWKQNIPTPGIRPIGMVKPAGELWLSDGDHNRLVSVDQQGMILQEVTGFDRPMHINDLEGDIFIPEYGADIITKFSNGTKAKIEIAPSLNAPSGIDIQGENMAIVNFYDHEILYFDGANWVKIGKEGHDAGQLYYPTDVQIIGNKIYVADAYNHRVQIFDQNGKPVSVIGDNHGLNAATGLFVNEKEDIYITDFENSRVLVFDTEGRLLQEIKQGINKPTDILIKEDTLFVCNYKGESVSMYIQE